MQNKMSWYFSKNNPKYQYRKIEKHLSKNKFDPLYAMFETCYHFQEELSEISKKDNIRDSEFVFSAISFIEIHNRIIEIFSLLYASKDFTIDYSDLIKECIVIPKPLMGVEEIEDIDILLFKEMGIYNVGDNLENKTNRQLSYALMKNVRNKLVHPNSRRYDSIHIGGNYPGAFGHYDSKKKFDFKSSFYSKKRFRVDKKIFIYAIEKLIDFWEKNIFDATENFLKIKLKGMREPRITFFQFSKKVEKIDKWSDDPRELKDFLPYKTYDLWKIANYQDKEHIKNTIFNIYKINKFLSEGSSESEVDFEMFGFDISKKIFEYIAKKIGINSAGYAHEKIGYWDDDEYKEYFEISHPEFVIGIEKDFSSIDDVKKEGASLELEQKIIIITSQGVDWYRINKATEKVYDNIKQYIGDYKSISNINIDVIIENSLK